MLEGPDKCTDGAHIECDCDNSVKIPHFALSFVRAQMDRSPDINYVKLGRMSALQRNFDDEKKKEEEKRKGLAIIEEMDQKEDQARVDDFWAQDENEDMDLDHDDPNDPEFEFCGMKIPKKVQNTSKMGMTAHMIAKTGISYRQAATIINAALVDLGFVKMWDTVNLVDHSKLFRAVKALSLESRETRNEKARDQLSSLYFDSKANDVLVPKLIDGNTYYMKSKKKEDDYVILGLPDPGYLFHIPSEKGKLSWSHPESS